MRRPDRASRSKRRVAVLGGGVGGMTAAFALTDPDNPESDNLEVTVYQTGWRLGGKGASGRSLEPDMAYRIEEHGLHVWFGCYDNAFRVIRKCYDELGRPPDAPLAAWTDAFKPHTMAAMEQDVGRRWYAWTGQLPTNDAVPGEGDFLPLSSMLIEGYRLVRQLVRRKKPSPTGLGDPHLAGPLGRRFQRAQIWVEDRVFRAVVWTLKHVPPLRILFEAVGRLVIWVIERLLVWWWNRIEDRAGTEVGLRRAWVAVNTAFGILKGCVENDVLANGLNQLNDWDLREWLDMYAVSDGHLTINSSWLRGIYDGMFAYRGGDNTIPPGAHFPPNARIEAGEALRMGFRLALMYKGAAVWKMQAGMGDTIFAPMYEVLRRRGVKFKLFHTVTGVRLTEDGSAVQRIDVARQVTIKPDVVERGGYDPLIIVKGLPCWPSTPLYDQIVEGDALKQRQVDLEAWCTDWEPVDTLSLVAGEDFDDVVYALALGSVPYVACDLVQASRAWKLMVDKVETIRTIGVQLWFNRTAFELGWTRMGEPLLSSFDVSPLDTWGDMTHLIPRESWTTDPPPESNQPGSARDDLDSEPDSHPASFPLNLCYLTGPMADPTPLSRTACGPRADCEAMDQKRWDREARRLTKEFVENNIHVLFPNLGRKERVRWDWLVDNRPGFPSGEARLDSQFFHANVQPSERYVLSVPGSSQYRLAPGGSGFGRLYLAGDWTAHNLNVGCVESATMSGLLASNAICGYPKETDIAGLHW